MTKEDNNESRSNHFDQSISSLSLFSIYLTTLTFAYSYGYIQQVQLPIIPSFEQSTYFFISRNLGAIIGSSFFTFLASLFFKKNAKQHKSCDLLIFLILIIFIILFSVLLIGEWATWAIILLILFTSFCFIRPYPIPLAGYITIWLMSIGSFYEYGKTATRSILSNSSSFKIRVDGLKGKELPIGSIERKHIEMITEGNYLQIVPIWRQDNRTFAVLCDDRNHSIGRLVREFRDGKEVSIYGAVRDGLTEHICR